MSNAGIAESAEIAESEITGRLAAMPLSLQNTLRCKSRLILPLVYVILALYGQ